MNSEQLPVTSEEILQKDKKESQEKSGRRQQPPPPFGVLPLRESLDAPRLEASATLKTRGVRPPRGTNAQVLQGLAKKAAHSNSRNDVHEYMRIHEVTSNL